MVCNVALRMRKSGDYQNFHVRSLSWLRRLAEMMVVNLSNSANSLCL